MDSIKRFGFSNSDGVSVLSLGSFSEELELKLRHGFYEQVQQTIQLKKLRFDQDTAFLKIALERDRTQHLAEVQVTAPGVPEIVYQSKKYSVSDFEFMENGKLLLLLYPKRLEKGGLLAISETGKLSSTFEVREKPKELVCDFRGNAHVVCEKGVYGIHLLKEKIGVSTIEKSYFMKYVFPIIDTSDSKYYFSNFNKDYPAFDYLIYDQLDSSYQRIIEIKDDLMMELYRSEYKWVDVRTKLWARNQEIQTGIDKEIWVGANYFTRSLYYKELYAPMFHRNDSIFVFDYYRDYLYSFDTLGAKQDSVAIFHHYQPKKSGWKRMLVQDKDDGKVYAYFEKDGICSIREVSLKTGKLGKIIRLKHRYVDNLAVYGGQIYYIYRPFESAQKKYLYRVTIPR